MALEQIKTIFVSVVPLIILFPTLNDMVGDYGIIISSRFSTLLHTGKIKENLFGNRELNELFARLIVISLLTAVLSSALALAISGFSGHSLNIEVSYKIFLISMIDVALLVSTLFFIAIFAGLYSYKRNEDPDNLVIPITTSIADFGNMLILAALIVLFF